MADAEGHYANLQQAFYTRYKKAHGLLFQCISAPNGLFIDMYGPAVGRHNDLWLLNRSGIKGILGALFAGLIHYTCYGDSIYVPGFVIVRPFRAAVLPPLLKRTNHTYSKQRIGVENLFGKAKHLWKYCDHEMNVALLRSPVGTGRAMRVAFFLTNLHTCA